MGKATNPKPRIQLSVDDEKALDATPERLAKGPSTLVEIKADGQTVRTTKVRQFTATKLDRLHRNGQLTWVQWFAGDWYREKAHDASTAPSAIGAYGQGSGGGAKFYAFLPRTVSQCDAQDQVRAARQQWSREMQGFMERFLIRDDLPRYGGSKAMRSIRDIRKQLDILAEWLRVVG